MVIIKHCTTPSTPNKINNQTRTDVAEILPFRVVERKVERKAYSAKPTVIILRLGARRYEVLRNFKKFSFFRNRAFVRKTRISL
jgi:hypothetical protein